MKDAAVNRSAKSITQLSLCQVTTSEVDAATKLLDKACQKLQGIQNIPLQRSLTSKLPYANFAKLTAFWIASSEELNTQISPRTDEEHNLHTMKTIGKSTRVRGCLPILATIQVNRLLSHQHAPFKERRATIQECDDWKSTTERTLSVPCGLPCPTGTCHTSVWLFCFGGVVFCLVLVVVLVF